MRFSSIYISISKRPNSNTYISNSLTLQHSHACGNDHINNAIFVDNNHEITHLNDITINFGYLHSCRRTVTITVNNNKRGKASGKSLSDISISVIPHLSFNHSANNSSNIKISVRLIFQKMIYYIISNNNGKMFR